VPADYWEGVAGTLAAALAAGQPAAGLIAAVRELGAVLARHWPRLPADRNELDDQVSLGGG
jgi:uncharacterized membrane protein